MDIKDILIRSFVEAKALDTYGKTTQLIQKERSMNWVKTLAQNFRSFYSTEADIYVFSKDYEGQRDKFGLNELLYDVSVCRAGTVPSAAGKKNLYCIKQALWQMESELARDSFQTLKDFNKLVLGSAENKLFIASQIYDIESFINVLVPAAACCNGNVYLCLIPHPQEWKSTNQDLMLWKFVENGWVRV